MHKKTAQHRNELSEDNQDTVILENHGVDVVGRLIGGNPATPHKIPDGSSTLIGLIKMLYGKNYTVHGCSDPTASPECGKDYGKLPPPSC